MKKTERLTRFIGKNAFTITLAIAFLIFLISWSFYYANPLKNGDLSSPLGHSSVEIGASSLSPNGISGGSVIPASCPSYEHFLGECAGPPTITVNPRVIPKGGTSTLRWGNCIGTGLSSANPATSQWQGSVSPIPAGSKSVSPAKTTTYTITCNNGSANGTLYVGTIEETNP